LDPDRILVAQALAGSRVAFDELITRHEARILRLARIMTGNDGDAEDLVQETFVRAFRMIRHFRGDSAFGTWLHRIAINVITSHLQRRRRARARTASPTVSEDQRWLEEVPSGEDVAEDVVRRLTIDRALAELPRDLRLLVTLRDLQGLRYQEIADLTGLKLGSVASGVFRARRRLRPMLSAFVVPLRRSE
jgi:RNA polymerase sigma-70 factor (ECF subfamily)